jgi:hypothetical protein
MARLKLFWNVGRHMRLGLGADLFGGPETGIFGRYKQSKRVISEARYTF